MSALMTVPFHGTNLFIVEHHDEPFVPMRPIVEGMGMAWQPQHRKLVDRFEACITHMVTQLPGDDQAREVVCLPLKKLPAWMYSVNPKKVEERIRQTIIDYQAECDDALWAYWNEGHAVNPRAQLPAANDSAVEFAKLALEHLPNLGDTSKQALLSHISELAYGQRLIPLPKVEENLLLAGQVGELFGVTGNRIGKLANQHGMKIEQYGEYRLDKSRYSSKQVETFHYNQAAVERFREILQDV
ncbi:phage antirepressor N-terminal domain-containing protein [Pseudomonas protegens]|uniref:phage antirepressor N-terminal domain-containing protein n=1 Tax=Pseudomonas protegens TaxID=380021 RepID=UPI0037FEE81D